MNKKFLTKIGTGALACAMLFTLVACGNSKDEDMEETEAIVTVSAESETDADDIAENPSLIGTWQSEPDADGTYFDALVTDDDVITVYRIIDDTATVDDNTDVIDEAETDTDANSVETDADTAKTSTADVYWVGSYTEPDANKSMSGFTSYRAEDTEMTSTADTLRFTYHTNTDELYFPYNDGTGDDVNIGMTRAEESSVLADVQEFVNIDVYKEIVDADNTEDVEPSSDDTAPSENTNNLDDSKNTANNDDVNTADKEEVSNVPSVSADTNAGTETSTNTNTSSNTASDTDGNATSSNINTSTAQSNNTASNVGSSNSKSTSCAHSYGSGTVTVKATCTKDGTRTYTCSKCGAVKTEAIPATGHSYSDSVTKPATCGVAGVRTHTCANCGDTYTTTISATGNHTWQNVTEQVYVAETGHYETVISTTPGYKCSACGDIESSVREIGNHIELVHNGAASYSGVDVPSESKNYVVDTPAHYETVVTGQKCSVCGATK